MGMFEYVMVVASIVVGLGMTHLLQGLAEIVQHPRRTKVYWVHLLWVGWAFLQMVFWWWWEFRFETVETWTFPLYLFILVMAFLLYLMGALLFPKDLADHDGDFRVYFHSRRAWFFGLFVAFFALDLIDTLLKGTEYFASLGFEYPIAMAVIIAGGIAGIVTRNVRFHGAFAAIMFTYQLLWAFRYSYTVQG
jgi:hypothetical protein